MPKVVELVTGYYGKEPYKNINPDECVALGASIQGGVLAGEVDNIVLLDVTPLTLGVETYGGVLTTMIERNTTIPTHKQETFSTAADSQTSVEIHVLQGERQMAADNISLGRFNLVGIPPAPRNVPKIEVSFDIDANGILNVKALDLGTKKEQKITITATSNLSEEEIQQKIQDAEKYSEEDKARREEIDTKNQGESLVHAAQKAIKEWGEKVTDEQKSEIEASITMLNEAVEANNTPDIKTGIDDVNEKLQNIGSAIYQQVAAEQAQQQAAEQSGAAGAGPADGSGPEPQAQDDNVVDADYSVVDDETATDD